MNVSDGSINFVMTTVRHIVAINSFNNFTSSWLSQFMDPLGIPLEFPRTAMNSIAVDSQGGYDWCEFHETNLSIPLNEILI